MAIRTIYLSSSKVQGRMKCIGRCRKVSKGVTRRPETSRDVPRRPATSRDARRVPEAGVVVGSCRKVSPYNQSLSSVSDFVGPLHTLSVCIRPESQLCVGLCRTSTLSVSIQDDLEFPLRILVSRDVLGQTACVGRSSSDLIKPLRWSDLENISRLENISTGIRTSRDGGGQTDLQTLQD